MTTFETDIVVVGGCGRVGLPLALAFAGCGLSVVSLDIDTVAVATVNQGRMPFDEPGAPSRLVEAIAAHRFRATADPTIIETAEHVVVVIGTPVDEHLNPDLQAVSRAIEHILDHLRAGQHLVLRSTVYPGVTRLIEGLLDDNGLAIDVTFCPERIAEGTAFTELFSLPQIVSGRTPRAVERASALFRHFTSEIVELEPEEAELAKLFTNTWRYIKFAAANQFYMIANDFGLDFERIRQAIRYGYPRAADMPGAGFAAGPCLFKDTMQLAAFHENNFSLGHASMMINEGLPLYVVGRLERQYELRQMTVGILGMTFKAESDDTRSSLSYKLRRILRFKCRNVLCHDPFVDDPSFVPLETIVEQADIMIIGAPHRVYQTVGGSKPVIDIWNLRGAGVLV